MAKVDDERAAVLIPALGSAVGLGTAIALTAGRDAGFHLDDSESPGGALLQLRRGGPGVGAPLPQPAMLPSVRADGSLGRQAGIGLRLVEIGW